jgi:hypothetical protein
MGNVAVFGDVENLEQVQPLRFKFPVDFFNCKARLGLTYSSHLDMVSPGSTHGGNWGIGNQVPRSYHGSCPCRSSS